MSFVTAQQTKLDLELVPKEERLEIRKCNGRLNPGKKQREPTFQVVMDALALNSCYSAFFTTADVQKGKKKKFYLNLETFRDIFQICQRVHGQDFDKLPTDEDIVSFFKELDKTVSRRNKIGMHTSKDDYLINTLRFVTTNEESQIYEARLPESMTSPEMRETKSYKTYIGYATGVTPPKKAKSIVPKIRIYYLEQGYCYTE
nr:hypothetical protein [Tanacetum cinerariifolium]